jgi:hypothetical protein
VLHGTTDTNSQHTLPTLFPLHIDSDISGTST